MQCRKGLTKKLENLKKKLAKANQLVTKSEGEPLLPVLGTATVLQLVAWMEFLW